MLLEEVDKNSPAVRRHRCLAFVTCMIHQSDVQEMGHDDDGHDFSILSF